MVDELVLPRFQVLEALPLGIVRYLRVGDVVDQHAAVSTPIECSTKTLKPFLTGSIPDLPHKSEYLEMHDLTINHDLLFHEVSPDGGAVALRELLIDVAASGR